MWYLRTVAVALAVVLTAGVAVGTADRLPTRDGADYALTGALESARVVWRHSNGHFENTLGNTWIESSPDGRFTFREVFRGGSAITLYDAGRDCHVRLTASACYVKFGTGSYQMFYRGYWER